MPASINLRDHYTAQEDQAPDFAVPYTDFGARQYNTALRRWMTPDPLSEKYYGISPYAFCAGNPVVYIDYNGESIGKVVKVGKKVYKTIKTGKKLNLKNILKSEVIDIADNVRTIFSEDVTWFERGFAIIDLATGFGEEAKWLAKTVGVSDGIVDGAKAADAFDDVTNAAKIHGNSRLSTKAQHAYDIIDTETNTIVKTGVSGGPIKNDKSSRAEKQVREWNKKENTSKYKSIITHKEPEGEGARERILQYEKERSIMLREKNHLNTGKHQRP